MRKILMSVLVMAAALAVAGLGLTGAWFSDVVSTAEGAGSPRENFVQASQVTVELKGGNPIEIGPLCPSQWDEGTLKIKNTGYCDGKVWLHLTNVFGLENDVNDPENKKYWEVSQNDPDALRFDNDLERYITFDVARVGTGWIVSKDDHVKMADVECQWIPLGDLGKSEKMDVKLSFHIQGDEVDNRYQTDKVVFDVEFKLQQASDPNAPWPAYNPSDPDECQWRVLHLEDKDDQWIPEAAGDRVPSDGVWEPDFASTAKGTLRYDCKGPTFRYKFEAEGLQENMSYKLIYYADPWPGTGTDGAAGCRIATLAADSDGRIGPTGLQETDLGMDLPQPSDWNASHSGAKIWLVPASDYSGGEMVAWNPDNYLFEMRLINYNDTEVA
jgi:hypothetical protein